MRESISRETCQKLGRCFHELRLQQHLTLYKVYQQSGMSAAAIDNIEIGRGNLPLAWYLKLADFYGKKIKIEIAD